MALSPPLLSDNTRLMFVLPLFLLMSFTFPVELPYMEAVAFCAGWLAAGDDAAELLAAGVGFAASDDTAAAETPTAETDNAAATAAQLVIILCLFIINTSPIRVQFSYSFILSPIAVNIRPIGKTHFALSMNSYKLLHGL